MSQRKQAGRHRKKWRWGEGKQVTVKVREKERHRHEDRGARGDIERTLSHGWRCQAPEGLDFQPVQHTLSPLHPNPQANWHWSLFSAATGGT